MKLTDKKSSMKISTSIKEDFSPEKTLLSTPRILKKQKTETKK